VKLSFIASVAVYYKRVKAVNSMLKIILGKKYSSLFLLPNLCFPLCFSSYSSYTALLLLGCILNRPSIYQKWDTNV